MTCPPAIGAQRAASHRVIVADVSVNAPDTLDLSQYRSEGLLKDEVLLPDISPPAQKPPAPLEVDEEAVIAISQMGFPPERCRAAIVATGNMGAEAAIMWLMENPGELFGVPGNRSCNQQICIS